MNTIQPIAIGFTQQQKRALQAVGNYAEQKVASFMKIGDYELGGKIGIIGKNWIDRTVGYGGRTYIERFEIDPNIRNILLGIAAKDIRRDQIALAELKNILLLYRDSDKIRQMYVLWEERERKNRKEARLTGPGRPWWVALDKKLLDKPSTFRTDVALNITGIHQAQRLPRPGIGALWYSQSKFVQWKRDGNYLMAPFISKSGHSITIAVDCSKKSLNHTRPGDNKWMSWMSGSSLNVPLKTLIKDVCSVYG